MTVRSFQTHAAALVALASHTTGYKDHGLAFNRETIEFLQTISLLSEKEFEDLKRRRKAFLAANQGVTY